MRPYKDVILFRNIDCLTPEIGRNVNITLFTLVWFGDMHTFQMADLQYMSNVLYWKCSLHRSQDNKCDGLKHIHVGNVWPTSVQCLLLQL